MMPFGTSIAIALPADHATGTTGLHHSTVVEVTMRTVPDGAVRFVRFVARREGR
jgi:hypothetical protein